MKYDKISSKLCIIIFAILIIMCVTTGRNMDKQYKYVKENCDVVDSYVESYDSVEKHHKNSGTRKHRTHRTYYTQDITVSYEYDGREYEHHFSDMHVPDSNGFTYGDTIEIYVDKNDPASVTERNSIQKGTILYIFSAFMAILSILLIRLETSK